MSIDSGYALVVLTSLVSQQSPDPSLSLQATFPACVSSVMHVVVRRAGLYYFKGRPEAAAWRPPHFRPQPHRRESRCQGYPMHGMPCRAPFASAAKRRECPPAAAVGISPHRCTACRSSRSSKSRGPPLPRSDFAPAVAGWLATGTIRRARAPVPRAQGPAVEGTVGRQIE